MTGNLEQLRSRIDIDARARTTRLALERNAVAFEGTRHRLLTFDLSIAELWRRAFMRGARATDGTATEL